MATMAFTQPRLVGLNSKTMSNSKKIETEQQKKVREFEEQAVPLIAELYPKALAKVQNNKADADDLMQEVMAKAFRYWHTYQQGTNLGGWLYTILKNTAINRGKKEAKHDKNIEVDANPGWEMRAEAESSLEEEHQSAEIVALAKLTSREVTDALEKLNPNFRNVVKLAILDGYSYKEISEILNMEMGTVMSSLHRGKKKLRELLYEYASEEGYNVGDIAAEAVAKKAAKGKKK